MFKRRMTKLYLFISLIPVFSFSQESTWVSKPFDQWPPIALINEVWYQNGDRYVDPSFEYAGTGFLIDTGQDTLAVTAKHVLWVARSKNLHTVDLNGELDRWIMRPKGHPEDSVVIDELINADSTEILSGPLSTITQRDWLVFSTRYITPGLTALKPRFTGVQRGEKIWWTGCPYSSSEAVVFAAVILEIEGDRIVFSMPPDAQVGGASGSPMIDQHGKLIGILGGSTRSKTTGEPAFYGLSNRYLEKVLKNDRPYNQPLIPISEVIKPIIMQHGLRKAIRAIKEIRRSPECYFIYDFKAEIINQLAAEIYNSGEEETAVGLLKLSIKEFAMATTYNQLAEIYFNQNKKKKAKKSYREALQQHPENQQAMEGLQCLQSGRK